MPLNDIQTALVETAQDANKRLKEELVHHAAKLQAELLSLDQLIATTESVGDADLLEDAEDRLIILVEGAKLGPQYIHPSEFDDTDSPFYADAQRRQEYITFTTARTMTTKEKDQLALCVHNANMRVYASHAQERGENPFEAVENAQDTEFFDSNIEHLDWDSIAAEFNAAIYPIQPRSALECEVFWRDGFRPNINRTTWSGEEVQKLEVLVQESEEDPPDWEDIASKIGNGRVALDCMKQFHLRPAERAKDGSKITSWTKEDDARLDDAVKMHGLLDWQMVSMAMHGAFSAAQCEAHWRSLNTIKRGPWEAEEDDVLRRAVGLFSAPETTQSTDNVPWRKVAPLVQGRTRVQCRDRWLVITGMRRTLAEARRKKASWTPEEDERLRSFLGDQWEKPKPNIDWKEAAQTLGRKERNCRSRWRTLRKALKCSNGRDDDDENGSDEDGDNQSVTLRSSHSEDDMHIGDADTELITHSGTRSRPDKLSKTNQNATNAKADIPNDDDMDVDIPRTGFISSAQDAAMAAAAGTLIALGQASTTSLIPQVERDREGNEAAETRRSTRSTRHRGSLLDPLIDSDDIEVDNKQTLPTRQNKLKRWTDQEDTQLLEIVARRGNSSIDWKSVAEEMKGRTPPACSARYNSLRTKRKEKEQMQT